MKSLMKVLSTVTLFFGLLLSTTPKSSAGLAIALSAPTVAVVGTAIWTGLGVAGLGTMITGYIADGRTCFMAVRESERCEKTVMERFRTFITDQTFFSLVLGGIFLDHESGLPQFKEIDQLAQKKLGLSEQDVNIFNGEVEEINVIGQKTLKDSLNEINSMSKTEQKEKLVDVAVKAHSHFLKNLIKAGISAESMNVIKQIQSRLAHQ